jgi:TolA-binding protein
VSESIIVALITGVLSLLGVVITNVAMAKKSEKDRAVAQAITDTKLDELTREVREHNNFAQKMPVLQSEIHELQRRVSQLEKYHQAPTN